MSEDFGNDFITIIDDDGNEFNLELLDTIDYNGETFSAFLPADMDEDDFYHFMLQDRRTCPFYRNGDEYAVVRHQM